MVWMEKESKLTQARLQQLLRYKHRLKPLNVADFMGMVNELGKLPQKKADLSQPFGQLLSKSQPGCGYLVKFKPLLVKAELTKPSILTHYNPQAPTKHVQMHHPTVQVLF